MSGKFQKSAVNNPEHVNEVKEENKIVKTPAVAVTSDDFPQANDMMVDSENTESYVPRVAAERDPTYSSHEIQNGRRKKLPIRPTHLEVIFDYLKQNRSLGLNHVCTNLSITKNIVRLIYYTLDKKDKNDLLK